LSSLSKARSERAKERGGEGDFFPGVHLSW